MKGKLCDSCGHFTLFLMNGFLICSECGLSVCNEWGEKCQFNLRVKDQEKCLECYRMRLSPNGTVKGGERTIRDLGNPGLSSPIIMVKGGSRHNRSTSPSLESTTHTPTLEEVIENRVLDT